MNPPSAPINPRQRSVPRPLITAFIIVHLFIMAIWGLPGSKFRNTLARWVQHYVVWIGLWHSWDMFAPEPLSLNFSVHADITFADGTSTTWTFPRMEQLGYWSRFENERWRKMRERVRQDVYRAVWADTARWIARQHDNGTNRPVQVELTRQWSPVPPPTSADFQPMPAAYPLKHQYRFFNYHVQKEDL